MSHEEGEQVSKDDENSSAHEVSAQALGRSQTSARLAAFKKKHPPFVPVAQTCIYLLILFLGIQSYFYGSLFQAGTRTHNLHVLAIDYDQGIIGTSLKVAYDHLKGPDFLTLDFQPAAHHPDPARLTDQVCGGRYWGTLYTVSGVSARFQSAISGNSSGSYDASSTIIFNYNGIRYPVIGEAFLTAGMAQLTGAATQALHTAAGPQLISAVNQSNAASIQALYQPLNIHVVVQNSAPQGSVILLNTFTMIVRFTTSPTHGRLPAFPEKLALTIAAYRSLR